MPGSTVAIVGAGVVGLSAAYHLAMSKWRVIILEKDSVGAGSSSRAAGITTRLLWSDTGVRARGIGIEWFHRLSDELGPYGYTYHDEHGCLNLFTPDGWTQRAPLLPLYDRLDARYEVLSAQEIHRRWPALHPPDDFVGLHDPMGGYSEPDDYIAALSRRVRDLGVEIVEGQVVSDLITTGGRVSGVVTSLGRLCTDAVISSVHSWGPNLWRNWGLQLPMKSFVHQRYVSEPLTTPFVAPAVNADPYQGYARPARGGRILLGVETPDRPQWNVESKDFQMGQLAASPDLLEQAVSRFAPLIPALGTTRWQSESIGLIAFSSDGEPILGPVAQLPGLFVAGGFHSGGFSYNTVAGMLLAEMVDGRATRIDISAFSPSRFDPAATTSYLAENVPQSFAVRRRH